MYPLFLDPGFNGKLEDITSYQMVLINTFNWLETIKKNRYEIEQLGKNWDTSEELYGWCVAESLKRAFPSIKVLSHFRHDFYEYVYDNLFVGSEFSMRNLVSPFIETPSSVKCLRVLPMLDKTMLALGK